MPREGLTEHSCSRSLRKETARGGHQGRCQLTDWPVGTGKATLDGRPEKSYGKGSPEAPQDSNRTADTFFFLTEDCITF